MKLNYRTAKNAEAVSKFWGKPLEKPDWFRVEASSDDEAEILIYDYIGWPFVEASAFVRELSAIKAKKITVRINSPGGDVFDSFAIFNALQNHTAKVVTRIEGIAASAASFLALAGAEVQAHANTMMMIHDPWIYAAGNQYELRDMADVLEKISGNMLEIYVAKSKIGKREMKQMMADETWLTAKEAKEKGFIDTLIEDGKPVKARFDLSMYANVPEGLDSSQNGGRELTEREIERALRDAGASRKQAKTVAAGRSGGHPEPGDQRDVDTLKDSIRSLISKFKEK